MSKRWSLSTVKYLHISYKHSENNFVLARENITNSQEIDPAKCQKAVDRNSFIQEVLLKRITNKPPLHNESKTIVIDFSSPNIAKPFHAGHLRSTIIGNYIANINKYFGSKVTKINYLGDWGTQFGLLQYGLKSKNINVDILKQNPIKTLYEVYVHANKLSLTDDNVHKQACKYFSEIEQGKTNLDDWKKIREITVQELKYVYQRLGINFDAFHWESDYHGEAIRDLMQTLENKNIIKTDSTGKKVARINDRDVTVLKSDNSSLYLSRDVAALLDRYKQYKFDKMLYVVDNAQTDHFTAVFEIVKRLNDQCSKRCEHIKFGRIKGMSTRSGNVVFLNDILDEAKQKMQDKQKLSKNSRDAAMNDKTCDILGTTAVIVNDLKQNRQKDYVFDWNRMLQSEGDSGIKLQYLHCRLWSLEQLCGVSIPEICDPNYLPEEVVGDVVAEMAKFEFVLHKALVESEACILVNYLFRLARHVNRMFNELKVKGVSADVGAQRMLVFHSSRLVVKTSLEILGLEPLYEM